MNRTCLVVILMLGLVALSDALTRVRARARAASGDRPRKGRVDEMLCQPCSPKPCATKTLRVLHWLVQGVTQGIFSVHIHFASSVGGVETCSYIP